MSRVGEERTVSPWVFIVVFAVLTVGSIVTFLGDSSGPVEQLDVAQTVPTQPEPDQPEPDQPEPGQPEPAPGSPTGESPSSDDSEPSEDSQTQDGEPVALPEGVREHHDSGGVASFTFEPPPDYDESVGFAVEIAPSTARLQDSSVVLEVSCGYSAQEFLAQVFIDKGPDHVVVTPLVVVPHAGAPCSDATSRVVILPLGEPAGQRTINVVPMGAPIPTVQSD